VSELGPEEKEQLNKLWEVIEKPKAEDGYKNISKSLNMQWSTVKSIMTKWGKYGTAVNLPRTDCP